MTRDMREEGLKTGWTFSTFMDDHCCNLSCVIGDDY